MAAEVRFRHTTTAETLYFTVRLDTNAYYWNGASTEILTVGNWSSYKISMTETPSGGYLFMGTIPNTASIPIGWYHLDIFKQITATATISDPIQASMFGYWNTVAFLLGATDVEQVQGAATSVATIVDANVIQGMGKTLVCSGTVTNGAFTPTTTEFESSELNAAATNHYQGRVIVFTSGTLKDQATSINSYAKVASNGHFYVAALTSAPANTDSFVIV